MDLAKAFKENGQEGLKQKYSNDWLNNKSNRKSGY
jgi:hypothetical protein